MSIEDSQLADVLGRELMRPLSSIQLITQLLARDNLSADARRQQQSQLLQLSQRTMALVDSLLLVEAGPSQLERPAAASLTQVVSDTADQLQPWLTSRQRPLRIYNRPLNPVYTRRRLIDQILRSILTSSPDSTSAEPIEVRFRDHGQTQSVRVRDYNSDLTLDSWQRLGSSQFASFVQPLPSNPSSSGLELYVARQLAERLGGELTLELKQTGNCFELRLPALYQPRIWQAKQW